MKTSRIAAWLLLPLVFLSLPSCGSDRMPNQPRIAAPAPPPTSTPTDSVLAANQAIWSSSGIDSYRYRFRWECYCVTEYVRLVDVTVTGGRVVSVVDAATRRPLDAQAAAQYLTVDGLFDFVRTAINAPAASIQSAFDPTLGYPASTYVDYVAGMADEEKGFRIYGLTPLRNR